jgi:Transposase DDE domain group 1
MEEVARLVRPIRTRWPRVRILLRADSGFAREALMRWCEENRVDFVFGLARNARPVEEIAAELIQAEDEASRTGKPARIYREFRWSTRDSWSRRRRVIAKAEWTRGEANPRFIITSLKSAEVKARFLYEEVYCARGDMENRIKECQDDLFADRTSAASMRANQLRLWFASMAYVLLCALRRIRLAHTQFAQATLRDHSAEALEDRRAGPPLGAAGDGRDGIRLSLSTGIRPRAGPITKCRRLSAASSPVPQPSTQYRRIDRPDRLWRQPTRSRLQPP